MKALRAILLGLAVIVFAAIGWHLVEAPPKPSHGPALADNTVPVTPGNQASGSPTAVASTRSAAPSVDPTRAPQGGSDTSPPSSPPAASPEAPSGSAPAPAASARPAASEASASAPPAQSEASPPASTPAPAGSADPAAEARARLLAALKDAPDLAAVFGRLQADYPAVAEAALAATAARTDPGRPASPDDLVSAAMRDLRQSSGVLVAKASPAALSAIFDTQAGILADLQHADARLCADYLYGGTSPEYADFAAGHRSLMAHMDGATLDAIADGRRAPVERDAPTAEDFSRVEAGLAAKGLSPDEVAALLDGKSLDPAPTDDRLCSNARAYLDVLHGLPEDLRMRIYGLSADLLARS